MMRVKSKRKSKLSGDDIIPTSRADDRYGLSYY